MRVLSRSRARSLSYPASNPLSFRVYVTAAVSSGGTPKASSSAGMYAEPKHQSLEYLSLCASCHGSAHLPPPPKSTRARARARATAG